MAEPTSAAALGLGAPAGPAGQRPIRVGMLGFGTVGTGAYRMLQDNREAITRKVGVPIEVVRIGVRHLEKERIAPMDFITCDLESIVDDPEIDVVLELMGGVSPAGELVERALCNGKHVVTANKELIAKRGACLIQLASREGRILHFEAAVGGGIPLIQPLKGQLSGNDVLRMMGILNGTTNYILTQMEERGESFETALADATAKCYTEADPSSDLDGYDAQYKLAIISSIAFGCEVQPEAVYREGITRVTDVDMAYAATLGYAIKLLGIVSEVEPGRILARVHPTLISVKHPLASVRGVFNALWFQGDYVGDVMFSGRGAGSDPTGSAVVGDLIDVCHSLRRGVAGGAQIFDQRVELLPIERLVSRYYLRMTVQDRPKVLGPIATAVGEHNVSIAAMEMKVLDADQRIGEIVFLTHPAVEADFRNALKALEELDSVIGISNWLRVED